MKILVTGGAGFIGSFIVDEYIILGHEVVIIDNLSTGLKKNINSKAKFYNADITNSEQVLEIFEKENFDMISHHAAQVNVRYSINNPADDARINIIGGINLFEAAAKTGVKKIIFSSTGGAIYGEKSQEEIPTWETLEANPCSPYGISKLTTEKLLNYYKLNHDIDFVILRYANVFGPRQNPQGEAGVVTIFINQILENKQPVINGTGEYTRDYVYISDVVAANVLALNNKMSGIFNVGTSVETTTNQVFYTIRETMNSQCKEIHAPSIKGEQTRSCISHKKINNNFDWYPLISFKEGIEKTVLYFKSNK